MPFPALPVPLMRERKINLFISIFITIYQILVYNHLILRGYEMYRD